LPTPNIFVTPEQIRGDRLQIAGGDAGHLLRVLRLGPGDHFLALDGTGLEYRAKILHVGQGSLEAVVQEHRQRRTEPRLRLTLGQGLPKGDKMEQVIRKGTELGLAGFQPLLTERCVAVPPGERQAARLARWQKIAAEAASQSGRAAVPPVAAPRSWTETVATFGEFDLVLLPWEGEETTSLKQALLARERPESVLALIGPEGGLTQSEVVTARTAGAIAVTLGPRILRTETAGLVLGAAVFYHYDELAMPETT